MTYVKIHTVTRVIRGITTEADAVVEADETLVDIGDAKLDIGFKVNPDKTKTYYKLDDKNKKVEATAEEINASGVDPDIEHQKDLLKIKAIDDAVDVASADSTLPASMKAYFQALKNIR